MYKKVSHVGHVAYLSPQNMHARENGGIRALIQGVQTSFVLQNSPKIHQIKQCVLPDRSVLIGQKMMENA